MLIKLVLNKILTILTNTANAAEILDIKSRSFNKLGRLYP